MHCQGRRQALFMRSLDPPSPPEKSYNIQIRLQNVIIEAFSLKFFLQKYLYLVYQSIQNLHMTPLPRNQILSDALSVFYNTKMKCKFHLFVPTGKCNVELLFF